MRHAAPGARAISHRDASAKSASSTRTSQISLRPAVLRVAQATFCKDMTMHTSTSSKPGIGHNRGPAPFFKEALPIGPAVIFRPARSAMTSGKGGTRRWVLRFERRRPLHIEPLMGWTANDDPMAGLELEFDSLMSAIDFAKRERIKYRVRLSGAAERDRIVDAERRDRVVERKTNIDDRNTVRESERVEAARTSVRGQNSTPELDRRLDQALKETFPASDPIAVIVG